ncbi:26S proteasome non-ATPase regulatory subunit 5-like isoform X2 [Xenia sp. Carnegie-2017]|uniref:26S proteasome non-ATPase regulatory subunit 5-like isoform X2 n=1 Tax=Xenia sp. Carnegie-2017 TaxID=2897299 RepID=UPI001F047472|nr:26S proteasome non-ATPase regulatory subunit 5-like isoform X2 [Xenia sp. Carnegie-2017]
MEVKVAQIARHIEVISSSMSGENVVKSLQELILIVDSRNFNGEQLLELIPPSLLFRRLSSSDRNGEIKHCSILLKKLLNYMKAEEVITKYGMEAMQGVNHPTVEVRELCLHQCERCVQTNNGVLKIIENVDLINYIIRNLAHSDMGCAKISRDILVSVSRHGDGLALLLQANTQSEFAELMKESDTICFRVFELFVKIFEVNQDSFEKFQAIFNSFVAKINSNDVLLQMNCIEMLTDLIIINDTAFQFAEETGVSQKLYDLFQNQESNPHVALLVPVKNCKFVMEKYPQFFEFIFLCITSNNDPILLPVALDTVGAIGQSNTGLVAMFQHDTQQNLMVALGEYLRNADEKIKIHCLECLASLFTDDNNSDNHSHDLIHTLYKKIHTYPLPTLFDVLKQPFNNVRSSCYKVLHSLSSFPWMLADMKITPGFFEYLLDRRTENEKEGQELKYEVIKKITVCPDASNIFDKPMILKLKQYIRDGPFYVGSDVSVIMDES